MKTDVDLVEGLPQRTEQNSHEPRSTGNQPNQTITAAYACVGRPLPSMRPAITPIDQWSTGKLAGRGRATILALLVSGETGSHDTSSTKKRVGRRWTAICRTSMTCCRFRRTLDRAAGPADRRASIRNAWRIHELARGPVAAPRSMSLRTVALATPR
jgi:hypothetical protein